MTTETPIVLVQNTTANGDAECFLKVGDTPVFGPGGVGAFLTKPTPDAALRAALRVALRTTLPDDEERCNNCSGASARLYPTRGAGLVCSRCIRANVDQRAEFARIDGRDD